VTPG